jgi:two-component system sensor histidine kinase UhpB
MTTIVPTILACLAMSSLPARTLRLDDRTIELRADDVLAAEFCEQVPQASRWQALPVEDFRPLRGSLLQFPSSSCAILLRIPIEVAHEGTWHLRGDFPALDWFEVEAHGQPPIRLGYATPWNHPLGLNRPTASLRLASGPQSLHVLVRDSSGARVAPFTLIPEASLVAQEQDAALLDGLFLGAFAILVLGALAAAIAFRRASLTLYAIHLSQALGYVAVHLHLGARFLWPDQPTINQWALTFFALTSGATLGLFANTWMEFRLKSPRLGGLHSLLAWILLGAAALHPFHPWLVPIFQAVYRTRMLAFAGVAMVVLGLVIALRLALRGNPRARQYLVAMTPYLATGGVATLLVSGPLDGSYRTIFLLLRAGVLLEVLLLGWFLFSDLGRTRRRHMQLLREHRALETRHAAVRDEAAREERRELARDIHDDLGQRLAGLRLAVAASSQTDRDRIGRELSAMQESLRSLTRRLHPANLEREGLASTLRTLAASLPVACDVEVSERWTDPVLPEAVHLLRMVQEMCGNALKHAQASRIRIALDRRDGGMILTVQDDGTGFVPGNPTGLGIPGLRERATLLGGTIALDSPPGGGCRWRVDLPD